MDAHTRAAGNATRWTVSESIDGLMDASTKVDLYRTTRQGKVCYNTQMDLSSQATGMQTNRMVGAPSDLHLEKTVMENGTRAKSSGGTMLMVRDLKVQCLARTKERYQVLDYRLCRQKGKDFLRLKNLARFLINKSLIRDRKGVAQVRTHISLSLII